MVFLRELVLCMARAVVLMVLAVGTVVMGVLLGMVIWLAVNS